MQEIDIDKNIEYLINLKIEDMFPNNILYPNQKSESSILEPKPDTINKKIINTSNIAHSVNNYTSPHYYDSIPNLDKNYKIDKKSCQRLLFSSDKEITVYDVFIRGSLIIACGGNLIKIYNKSNLSEAEITFFSEEENYYSMAYAEIVTDTGAIKKVLAAGGKRSVIKILDLQERKEIHELIGHRNEIYDLKFNPSKPYLLLSASQDFSVRLWHAINKIQICIFGGPNGGHNAEVISVDWHLTGQYFVSSGIDYFIKIWEITESINKTIDKAILLTSSSANDNNIYINPNYNSKNEDDKRKSEKKKEIGYKIKIKCKPIFSCNMIHENYVDCVKYNGNFILSKSVDGVIHEWQPFFNAESDSFYIINTYIYKLSEPLWYMKFNLETNNKKLIGVGNVEGAFFLFKLNDNINEESENDMDYFYKHKPIDTWYTPGNALIRSVSIDEISNSFVIGANEGNIYVGDLIDENNYLEEGKEIIKR